MSNVQELHRAAMDSAQSAYVARLQGDSEAALRFSHRAFELEKEAAWSLKENHAEEPTRSVLFRSAASLAVDCGDLREAERLVSAALAGQPPPRIAEELRDLFSQVNFYRHLELRDIVLDPVEVQFSIAGNAVGFGMAQSNEFVTRVQHTEKLIVRTDERFIGKPFRRAGRPGEEVRSDTELYLTVPRAASFAVSFRVGHPKEQLTFTDMDRSIAVIDELLDCLDLFSNSAFPELRERIKDQAYYNNFVGLAHRIAPDGNAVNVVGFTTMRQGRERKVALTQPRRDVVVTQALLPTRQGEEVSIRGILRYADSISATNQIKIVDDEGHSHKVIVPEGVLDDIVKPLWNEPVVIEGVRKEKTIELRLIREAGG